MALCGNLARSDALAVAPRALRASACGAVHIFATWASFCVAGCGDRACWEVCRGCAAGVLAAPRRGDWVRGVSRTRMMLRAATCVSRGRCGSSDALMRSGRHWTVDPRGRRNESCAVAKMSLKSLDFVALCDKSCARARVGRCEIVAGAGNPWICGCELGADVSWNAAAGCVGRVACAALCRGTQWQAVTMGVGRVARVACLALCHGDCCWARRMGAAVPWGLLLGVSRGCRCAMGIAGGRVAWVVLCHGDCWAGRADQGMVWAALCHWDW